MHRLNEGINRAVKLVILTLRIFVNNIFCFSFLYKIMKINTNINANISLFNKGLRFLRVKNWFF